MKKIKITLPDNSIKEVDHGSTPSDVALQIGPGLARSVVVAKAVGARRPEEARRV